MFKKIFLFVIFITSSFISFSNVDSLLKVLDATILLNNEYQKEREGRIQGLKSLFSQQNIDTSQKYIIYSKLYEEYRAYHLDSALNYLTKKTILAKQLNHHVWKNESLIQQVRLLSATGMYKEAFDAFTTIERQKLTTDQLAIYYINTAQMYSQLGFYTQVSTLKPLYNSLEYSYRDSALEILNPNSIEYLQELELKVYKERKLDHSTKLAKELLVRTKPNNPNYALYAYRMAYNYHDIKNHEKEKEYLIHSAIADIRNGIKDNASLSILAMMLYREKNIVKAYDYIQFSLSDASFFNAPLRFIELSSVLPLINEAYHLKIEKQKNLLERYLLLISFLIVFLLTSIVFIFIQFRNLSNVRVNLQKANSKLNDLNSELSTANKRLNGFNTQLSESNLIKEEYIGHFLSRCSNYIDKLDKYQRFVNKQIAAHKHNELFESTKSGKLIDTELLEFYETFDQTFLILFPNFVEQINELFKEEERIILRKGELLNTELRIFALIRLGISDSSKIASLLRYSVNTIYNYRVKVKNKALVPRDNFEEMVRNIGSFDVKKE
ncbi:MAG TPA: DUF6377 domain-containing protein [Prolixibacteraceae bacterium]|nr:DUF6377 domain-containing protein [Prolixibacteraceae bacterium]